MGLHTGRRFLWGFADGASYPSYTPGYSLDGGEVHATSTRIFSVGFHGLYRSGLLIWVWEVDRWAIAEENPRRTWSPLHPTPKGSVDVLWRFDSFGLRFVIRRSDGLSSPWDFDVAATPLSISTRRTAMCSYPQKFDFRAKELFQDRMSSGEDIMPRSSSNFLPYFTLFFSFILFVPSSLMLCFMKMLVLLHDADATPSLLQDDQRPQVEALHHVERARHLLRRLQRRRVQQEYPREPLQAQQRMHSVLHQTKVTP